MAGTLFGLPLSQRVDANGDPAVGWLLYLYQANTSTPVNSYQDTGLTVLNTWPVEADASGTMGVFWLADGSYRARATSNDGSIVYYDLPNILAIGASTGAAPPSGVDPNAIFKTGDTIWLDQTGTRPGWVRDNGLTIGSATSGATEPGGNVAAAQPLFEFLWNTYSNAICPVLPGRGGTSLGDWTANKKLTLPDKRGYIPGGVDDMGNIAAGRYASAPIVFGDVLTAGSVLGEATHVLTQAEAPTGLYTLNFNDPQHTHSVPSGGGTQATDIAAGGNVAQAGVGQTTGSSSTGITASLVDHGSNSPHNTVQYTVLGTFYRKL